jgi:hypothetical protein
LRGAVADLQAEDISQALRVGHFLGVGTVTVKQQTGLNGVERQLGSTSTSAFCSALIEKLKGRVMALLVVTAGDLRWDDRRDARTRR